MSNVTCIAKGVTNQAHATNASPPLSYPLDPVLSVLFRV